jgi:glycosyltransferase involved in cell wall biosynthesis
MPVRTVLICTTQVPFTTGGAESHVRGLREAFERAGYEAEVAALPFSWNPPDEIVRSTIAWRLLTVTEANGRPIDLVIGMKFPAYLVEHPNKVLWILHQHRSAYNLRGTVFDDLSTHADGPLVRAFIQRCDDRFIPHARKVFANSRAVADRLRRYNGIASEPLYHPPPRAADLRAGTSGDYVLYPSRVEPQKRQHLLIEAMRLCKTPVRAVLAGSVRDPDETAAAIARANVADRVTVTGRVDERRLIDLYADALAVAYLPFDEDLGYVPLEGMAAAKPVITVSDAGGGSEFVEDGGTGYVTDASPAAIAQRLDELYADRTRAAGLGRRGRDKYDALNLSWDAVVERLIAAGS